MVLSDSEIRRRFHARSIVIDPRPRDQCIQAASVDLTLSQEFMRFPKTGTLSATNPPALTKEVVQDGESFILEPKGFALGCTVERVEIPRDLIARVEGKSSLGRLGLMVHVTAGFVDPGFRGRITLELVNMNSLPIALTPGMRISQIAFEPVKGTVQRPYGSMGLGSKYQDSESVRGPIADEMGVSE